ncbi:Ig lambda chain V-III region LOI [Pelobates cultripes]|uniref:Ig lambda chain V-III region LOI n=1 Tax=Pelobates cultripes TaxID=61616 RepID=A0AAD1S7Z0_PELCU|nr:Ig lambda chain V-III region LOI [Pelobates cultripes]
MISLGAVIILILCSSCSSNIIQTPNEDVLAGKDVNLTCEHPSLTTGDYIHWYKMVPGQGLRFLISGFKLTANAEYKLVFAEDRKSSVLLMQNIRPEQTAVYLCASSDTVLQTNLQPV